MSLLQIVLDDIDSKRLANTGVFGGDVKKADIPVGQAACSELLYECYGAHLSTTYKFPFKGGSWASCSLFQRLCRTPSLKQLLLLLRFELEIVLDMGARWLRRLHLRFKLRVGKLLASL